LIFENLGHFGNFGATFSKGAGSVEPSGTTRVVYLMVLYEGEEMPGFSRILEVMEFKKGIFQAWKVMENGCGHRKSWNSTNRSWNFLKEG